MQTNNFNISTNIIRDENTDIKYIVTPNANDIYSRIVKNFISGIKCFNIIGSYGTGKSTFAWALEQNLTGKKAFFNDVEGLPLDKFTFLKFIGEASSFKKAFFEHFNLSEEVSDKDFFKTLNAYYKNCIAEQVGVVILVDEFGKYLEYAASNNTNEELYFIQQLAEFVSAKNRQMMFITTLHQEFSNYANELSTEQRQEWDKVKGRIKEIGFNEPIEQLLYLAANRLENIKPEKDLNISELTSILSKYHVTDKRSYIDEKIAENLYPFDYLSAEILVKSLQQFGQNERSLFSFLDVPDSKSIHSFDSLNAQYYHLGLVYDYLVEHYGSTLWTLLNPDLTKWNILKYALEKVESRVQEEFIESGILLVKVIGLINFFMHRGGNANLDFLTEYADKSLAIKNAKDILHELEEKKIIKYVNYATRYVFVDGTDLDIAQELLNANQEVQEIQNIETRLKPYFEFPYALAKATQYKKGTPRIFEFKLSATPLSDLEITGEIDGIINLIFSDELDTESLVNVSNTQTDAVIYVWYSNTKSIRKTLFDIDKIKYVKEKNIDDQVAVRELDERIDYEIQRLNQLVRDQLYNSSSSILWYWNGTLENVSSYKEFNQLLSRVADEVYHQTPVMRNDLFNKHKISSAIAVARKNYLDALFDNQAKENLGFKSDKYPPEKSIYLSLLHSTEIHQKIENTYQLVAPTENNSMYALWNASQTFIDSARNEKVELTKFVDLLSAKPFKLKQGFIDFWLPTFLIAKSDDFALFNQGGYIPRLTRDVLDLIYKNPKGYFIKTFDVSGVRLELFNKYRDFLQQDETTNAPKQKDFIGSFRPFVTFYRGLPNYTKNTKELSPSSLALRQAIAGAKDPESAFFEDFPKALGFDEKVLNSNEEDLKSFTDRLQSAIRELRSAQTQMIDRFEARLLESLGYTNISFHEYQESIRERYKSIEGGLLHTTLRNFHRRLLAPMDDKKDYLNGIASVISKKSFDEINDAEVLSLLHKINDWIEQLDQTVEVHKLKREEKHFDDEVYNFKLTQTDGTVNSYNVIISSKQQDAMQSAEEKMMATLDGLDKKTKEAVLIKLLQKHLNQ